jgi:uncharacterized protein (DUF2384 family)
MVTRKYTAAPKAKPTDGSGEKPAAKKSGDYVASDAPPSLLSDFEVTYNRMPRYMDDISLLKRAKEGLNAKAALDFLALSCFTPDEFQGVFKTTVKTIQNHVAKELTLDAPLSEKLLKCFALFDQGAEIFGTPEVFSQWLHGSAYGLGYQVPLEMMDTITGIRLVEEQLIRIAYGDLA